MQKIKKHLLCTRPVSDAVIKQAASLDIEIDVISFISTESLLNSEIVNLIKAFYSKKISVVFTSMNAVEQVASCITGKPDWKIYCIGGTGEKLVNDVFGVSAIAATANNAAQLAEIIIADKTDKVVFFCGNIRREELPQKLRNAKIDVEEVVVYKTIETPVQIKKDYDGILFFSPSAVKSFFNSNTIKKEPPLFAIGSTTAAAIKEYTAEKILTADKPGKDDLVRFALNYLNSSPKNINS
ncbi:uroporphyrinogen-III synthase [soil metagenome]